MSRRDRIILGKKIIFGVTYPFDKMKHPGLFLSLALLLMVGCGGLRMTPEQKQAEKERVASLVQKKLDERAFVIDVNYMIPRRGRSRSLTGGYAIAVNGETVDSHLPYAGVAYNVPYGGGKVLTFKDKILEYHDSGLAGDSRTVIFKTDNGEDTLVYSITVFGNGTATINVQCRNREAISYRGVLNVDR